MGAGRRDGGDLLIDVRVQPRASRTEFAGVIGDRLRIRLQAPPVDGRANAALVEFLAEAFGAPRAAMAAARPSMLSAPRVVARAGSSTRPSEAR